MTTMYFKTTTDDAAKALEQYEKERKEYGNLFQPLADEFNANPIFTYDIHGMRFYDLAFKDYASVQDKDLWTKPDSKHAYACRIRSSVRGKENIERLKELKERYKNLVPKGIEAPSRYPFYESLGVSWGDFVFAGLKTFVHEGVVYLATSLSLTKNVVEIKGGEFATAEKAHNQNK